MEHVRLTDRDLRLLRFAAEQRVILPGHVQALLGTSADVASRRLRALARGGFLESHRPFQDRPSCYQIRAAGLDAVASDLRPPRRLDLRTYDHEVGAAWLWMAARGGRFGPLGEVVGERRMRSTDAARERQAEPHGIRLGGVGPRGRERLHYPDLLLITPDGRRIALELELSSKGRVRREKILAGYAADARVDAVLYLVKDRRIGRTVQESARRLGAGALVHVQQVRWPGRTNGPAAGRAASRSPAALRGSVAEPAR